VGILKLNDKIKELLGSNYKVTEDERVLKVFHIMEKWYD